MYVWTHVQCFGKAKADMSDPLQLCVSRYELPYGWWEPNSDPRQKQRALPNHWGIFPAPGFNFLFPSELCFCSTEESIREKQRPSIGNNLVLSSHHWFMMGPITHHSPQLGFGIFIWKQQEKSNWQQVLAVHSHLPQTSGSNCVPAAVLSGKALPGGK